MRKPRVVIIDEKFGTYAEEAGELAAVGADLSVETGLDAAEVVRAVEDADGVVVNLYPVDAALIGAMRRCKVISRYGIGVDSVDIPAATAAGIWVANVPSYATEDVSDHAVALLLACVRKITFHDKGVRAGDWNLNRFQKSRRTQGKVLGIVGYGAIGRATHRKMSGFTLERVLACDPYIDASEMTSRGAVPCPLDDLLRTADYVSLHVPLNDETRHMIDDRSLGLMKAQAILVNTARGGVVDTAALTRALAAGTIHYAGLDVHEREPMGADSPLFAMDNVVLSDHCAWYTEESIVELQRRAARNVAEVLGGRAPSGAVNRPPAPRT